MPSDEARGEPAGRCERHPSSAAVAVCASCGMRLCIRCMIPVRGRVLGKECVAAELGVDPESIGPPPEPERPVSPWVGAGFALILATTLLPWSRYGTGAHLFGAWGTVTRWSQLTAWSGVAGMPVWFSAHVWPRIRWGASLAAAVLAVVSGFGAFLSILRPPPFSPVWIGPWTALAASLLTFGAALSLTRSRQGT